MSLPLIHRAAIMRNSSRSPWTQLCVRTNTTGRKPKLGRPPAASRAATSDTEKPSTTNTVQKKRKSRSTRAPLISKEKRPVVAAYEEPPILVPGVPADPKLVKAYYRSRHSARGGGSYRGGYTLPTIHVDALLDPNKYCKKSAFGGGTPTRHGTAAMQRLLQGKEHTLEVLRTELKQQSPDKPWSYAMVGHGVPHQLLQEHLNMAGSLRASHDGDCFFKNVHGDLTFDRMRVRCFDKTSKLVPWPPAIEFHPEWQDQMERFLTVMNRLVSTLGSVLKPREGDPTVSTTPINTDDSSDDDDFVTAVSSSSEPPSIRQWNAEVLGGTAYPPHSLPSPQCHQGPIPIVQWWPRSGSSAPGNVYIFLQGRAISTRIKTTDSSLPFRRPRSVPVTLVFDAGFRNA